MTSIYIHIPFCKQKCLYCDFYSIDSTQFMDEYVRFLCLEMDLFCRQNTVKSIDTIYIGGGTPSLLSNEQLSTISKSIERNFILNSVLEWTIECNPGTVTAVDFEFYLSLGINRLSIGLQSLNDNELKLLGRIHNAKEAEQTINAAQEAGFENISCDLMFALPNQTAKSWENTLDCILKFNLQHISAYSLIYEEGTPITNKLNAGKIKRKSAEFDYKLYEIAFTKLVSTGYEHYEISNYAKPTFESKHNLNYWLFGNYYGFGASAHSFFEQKRFSNVSSVRKYIDLLNIKILPIEFSEVMNRDESLMEQIFLSLRAKGLDINSLPKKSDTTSSQISGYINSLIKNDYAALENGILRLTSKGYFLTDEISVKFAEFF